MANELDNPPKNEKGDAPKGFVDLTGREVADASREALAQEAAQEALKTYDQSMKRWTVLPAEPSNNYLPFAAAKGSPILRPEDFQQPKSMFKGAPSSEPDFSVPSSLLGEERQRRLDMELNERRGKVADRIADQIAPGFGRIEWQRGDQKWRLDYLHARSCKLKGVGVCLTVKGF